MGFEITFKALGDATRRQILEMLRKGPMSAGEIADCFGITSATISHHLSVLKDAELVCDEKRGKFVYYELNTTVLGDIMTWIASFSKGNDDEKD